MLKLHKQVPFTCQIKIVTKLSPLTMKVQRLLSFKQPPVNIKMDRDSVGVPYRWCVTKDKTAFHSGRHRDLLEPTLKSAV